MKTETTMDKSHSEQQAIAQLESIIEMVRALDKETAAEDYAKELTREKCVELLKDSGFEPSTDAPVEDLRELVAEGICDKFGSIEPGDFEFDEEQATDRIREDALSVEVRSGWHTPGDTESRDEEFCILLCTGGPACRIIGELDQYGQPDSARLQHQDWGTPWTEHFLNSEQLDIVLTYCRQFYFGE